MRQISRSKPQPKVPVIWWSSKTIRLAQQRLRQLSNPAQTAEPFPAEELPDYVLVIEGSEPLRILQGAKEDLGDTVFESRAKRRSIRSRTGSSSTAKPQQKCLVRATIIRSHFALNSSRVSCAFTVCLTFEGEKLDYRCEKSCVGDVGQGAINRAGVAYFFP
jgi:hypothetical protein